MNEEDEAFNEIERMSKVRQEILRSLNRKRQIQDAEYKDMIEAAVLEEREACAKVCDRMAQRTQDIRSAALESAAENIRARGQA